MYSNMNITKFKSNKNKKAITEITSFVLILLVLTVITLGVYLYVDSELDGQIAQQDLIKVEKQFIKFSKILTFLENHPRMRESLVVSFNKGDIFITNSTIRYISEIKQEYNSTICVDLCYESYLGYDSFFINMTNTNLINLEEKLIPGTYLISAMYDNSSNTYEIIIE